LSLSLSLLPTHASNYADFTHAYQSTLSVSEQSDQQVFSKSYINEYVNLASEAKVKAKDLASEGYRKNYKSEKLELASSNKYKAFLSHFISSEVKG